ncbi:MAG: hypothetical protein KDB71_15900 [Mycobacterium sp.]|nr:hypothetical protein [Mycobacterium sp.]
MDELDPLWSRQGAGWKAMARGSGWRSDRVMFGVREFVRITEVVHHAHQGWNVHFHAPLLLEHPIDEAGLAELKDRLTTRFTRCVENAGGAATGPGQDLQLIRPGTESRIAGYLAKGTTASWSDESRTPQAILADLMENGEGLDIFKEFSSAVNSTKRRRISPSQSLDALMGLRR